MSALPPPTAPAPASSPGVSLPAWAVHRPVTVIMLVVTVLALGGICWWRTPLEFLMRIDAPFLRVYIPYPNAAPAQVEQEIAIPAEGAFRTIPGVERITTYSDAGGCDISLNFKWDAKIETVAAELRDRIERLRLQLPAEVDHISIRRFSTDQFAALRFALIRNSDEDDLALAARTTLRNQLLRLPGVAEVRVEGRESEEIYVDFDAGRLRSLGLDLSALIGTLQSSSVNVGVGSIGDANEDRYLVRARDEFSTAEDIANQIIGPAGLRLKDVATVTRRGPDGASSFDIDGKRGIFLSVVKESDANSVQVCDAVREELDRLHEDPRFDGAEVVIMQDHSEIIRFALGALGKAGLLGSALAFLVLFVFLGKVRTTLMVALMTPASLVLGFIFVYFSGRTLNMVTIASMLVALGMLVDNAIVVVENIHRYNELRPGRWLDNAVRGASEVALAITASTLTTVVVFIPVIYMDAGELATFTKEFAGPVGVPLIGSLLLALTVLPLVESRLERNIATGARKHTRLQRLRTRLRPYSPLEALLRGYQQLLGFTLRQRTLTIALLAGCVAVTYLIPVTQLGFTGAPEIDLREVSIQFRPDPNFGYERVEAAVEKLRKIIEPHRDELGIRNIYVNKGGWGGTINLFLTQEKDLAPGEDYPYSTDEVRFIVSEWMPEVPGARVESGVASAQTSGTAALQVHLRGDNTDELLRLAERLRDLLASRPQLSEVRTDQDRAAEEIQLEVDGMRATMSGTTATQVARSVDFALRGTRLPSLKGERRETGVWARYEGDSRRRKEDLETIAVQGRDGLIPLTDLVEFGKGESPRQIYREDGRTLTSVSATTLEEDRVAAEEDLRALVAGFALPKGYEISLDQRMRTVDENIDNFRGAIVLAVILIYLVMAALFESWLLPISILTTVPLAFLGVFWSMYLTSTPIDTVALVGAILMCGIIVNNGIVIVDHINQLQRTDGLDRYTAVLLAGRNRLRPVLMTTLTTVLGVVPLAIGSGGNASALTSLGRALTGGLTAGTILTLLVVPLAYTLIDDLQRWMRDFFLGLSGGKNAPAAVRGSGAQPS